MQSLGLTRVAGRSCPCGWQVWLTWLSPGDTSGMTLAGFRGRGAPTPSFGESSFCSRTSVLSGLFVVDDPNLEAWRSSH